MPPRQPSLAEGGGAAPRVAPRFGSVVFDCDSTLSAIEGIDELASAHRAAITAMTDAAMRGEIPLEEVYGRRLALVRPTRAQLDALGALYVERMIPDAPRVVRALRDAGVDVWVLSGGLLPAVRTLTRALGIPDDHVGAVDLYFDERGDYAGFDDASPMTRSGGKRTQLQRWGERLTRPVLMVGDGATDLEARPPADVFCAFAGVREHAAVVAAADVVIRERALAPVVPLALDAADLTSSRTR